jgi:probable F420-dependent oxidoreductase
VRLGRVGVWTGQLDFVPASEVQSALRSLEEWGFGAVWFGENVGRDPISLAGLVLAATERLMVATGIVNIWARDPLATVAAQLTLAEAYPERFVLGLGASHARLVEAERGRRYERPLARMREYLSAMDGFAERYRAVRPAAAPRVLAALGPKMLALAAERADGAHTYFVPPEHTAKARKVLGPGKLLAVEQAVVLETEPAAARALARRHTRRYLPLPNYTNNLRRLGFADTDFDREGSDRLVDAIVAWGGAEAVVRRVEDHLAAGADHVCLQVINPNFRQLPYEAWKLLGDALALHRRAPGGAHG